MKRNEQSECQPCSNDTTLNTTSEFEPKPKRLRLEDNNSKTGLPEEVDESVTLDNDNDKPINREKISLLWCDAELNEQEESFIDDIKKTKAMLLEINDFVQFSSNESEAIAYMETHKNEVIILIVSGLYASKKLIEKVHTLRHVDVILVFCMNKNKYESSSILQNSKYVKIAGIFDEQETLKQNIIKAVRAIEKQSAVFALYDPKKQKMARNIDHESGSFVWLQLVKEVIQRMPTVAGTTETIKPEDSSSKQEMLSICRAYYRDNEREMKNIDKFEQTYTAAQAVNWYTRNSFISKLINKALRTEDAEALYNYRFYLVDLCVSLEENCTLLRDWFPDGKLQLYRGLKLSRDEIQRLKNSEGHLVSMNSFFSTSRDKNVAEAFAGVGSGSTALQGLESVIFEVTVDLDNDKDVRLADISFYSPFKDEEEVLFDLATVFEIESMTCMNDATVSDKVWTCRVKPSNKGSIMAQDYIEFQQSQINKHNDTVILFGSLLYDMGAYDKSKVYFSRLNTQLPFNAHVLFGLGRASHGLCEYKPAIEYFTEACHLSISENPPDFAHAALIKDYISSAQRLQSAYHQALASYEDALDKYKKAGLSEQLPVANVLSGMGCAHDNLGNSALALDYFQQALDITIRFTPSNHQDRMVCYMRISQTLSNMGKYDEALNAAQMALNIGRCILPGSHLSISIIFNNIGKLLYKKREYNQALDQHLEDLKTLRNISAKENMPDFGICYNNIGKIYYRTGKYDEAHGQYEKALSILQNTLLSDHANIAYTLKNMGELFLAQSLYDRSADNLQRASEMYERIFSDNHSHPDKAKCKYLLGCLNEARHDDQKALSYYRQAHHIWKKILVDQHPNLTLCPKIIARLLWYQLRQWIKESKGILLQSEI